jgi:hypothetical protein
LEVEEAVDWFGIGFAEGSEACFEDLLLWVGEGGRRGRS